MTLPSLKPDCAQCAALCCVMPAFDRSDEFAIDKAAGEACPHLGPENDCRIYSRRAQMGFGGCISHDCLGAGQRVTQDVFEGRSWRDDPALAPEMVRAFSQMRNIHRDLDLLTEAAKLPLNEGERRTLHGLLETLAPDAPWTPERLSAAAQSDGAARVRTFLSSLRHHVDGR